MSSRSDFRAVSAMCSGMRYLFNSIAQKSARAMTVVKATVTNSGTTNIFFFLREFGRVFSKFGGASMISSDELTAEEI